MAGHSKWANIKHKKGAADAKRAKIFSKIIKEVTVAARLGGGDISANPRLRLAVDKAKSQSMPKDNIERAIKKGTGDLEGTRYDEISYEGYGPAGVALLVECMTDNKNRIVAEIRYSFTRKGGSMAETGAVSWMFEKKGVLRIDASTTTEDDLFDKALEAGADDITKEDDLFIVTTSLNDFHNVSDALRKTNISITEEGIEMIPKNTVKIEDLETAEKVLSLVDTLEDNDDVQNVWANFDIDDSLLEKIS
ncbi:MAG: YebC/PmpR family DNA-binding transcriptional regulator [bacterium]|nr:YebC/PmpR family DNA-binding transcriptional regulator [bacterium]MBU1918104.1 YebC/PmpR family DNA-binding transcriptional regulator [bacterium]